MQVWNDVRPSLNDRDLIIFNSMLSCCANFNGRLTYLLIAPSHSGRYSQNCLQNRNFAWNGGHNWSLGSIFGDKIKLSGSYVPTCTFLLPPCPFSIPQYSSKNLSKKYLSIRSETTFYIMPLGNLNHLAEPIRLYQHKKFVSVTKINEGWDAV